MEIPERWLAFVAACFIALLCLVAYPVFAHDHGRTDPAWEALSPETKEWFKTLMRPDMPEYSCCGESDHYWCDKVNVRQGKVFCTITDDRPDEQFKRPHVPVGTEIEIPPEKLKWDRGNPTGHSVVFLSSTRDVYCFVQNGGV